MYNVVPIIPENIRN